MDHLIVKYLQGSLTLEEQHELSKWKQQNGKNAQVLQKLEIYWKDHKTSLDAEELEVRMRLLDMMKKEQMSPSSGVFQSIDLLGYFLRLAAMILIGLGLVMVINNAKTTTEEVVEIALVEKVSLPGQKITSVLPDGTKVKLNGDSKIIAPSRFADDKREVTLIGEGFFEVQKDAARPFLINTESMVIKVLGTSFNVSAYKDGTPQSVAVRTGKVEVTGSTNENSIQLEPLQMTVYEKSGFQKTRITNIQNAFGWVDQKLVFDNQSIDEVFKKIAKWYGLEVEFRKDLTKNKNYTANYDNPSLIEVMDILAFVYDFEYEKNEETIIIK